MKFRVWNVITQERSEAIAVEADSPRDAAEQYRAANPGTAFELRIHAWDDPGYPKSLWCYMPPTRPEASS